MRIKMTGEVSRFSFADVDEILEEIQYGHHLVGGFVLKIEAGLADGP